MNTLSITMKETKEGSVPRKPGRKKGSVTIETEEPIKINSHPVNREINERFFKALYHLIDQDKLTFYRFCANNRISKPQLYALKRAPEKAIVPALYLTYLVKDGNISAHWLLTGEGEMIRY